MWQPEKRVYSPTASKSTRSVCKKANQKQGYLLLLGDTPAHHGTFLQLFYILSLRSSVGFLHLENHPVPFCQGLKARHVDGGKMDEQIPAILLLDEAIPLLLVEPFNRTLCQSTNLLLFLDRSSFPNFRSPLWQRTHPSKARGAGTSSMDAARPDATMRILIQ